MAESRYEKYVVRKPSIHGKDGQLEVPERIVPKTRSSTGPLIWCNHPVIEAGIIWGDITVGTGFDGVTKPHKHDGDETFLFLGTDPKDFNDLGAEAEFWLGEGDELDKVVINTSASVFVPGGLAHFPLTWKNVKRPSIFVVVAGGGPESILKQPVSLEGRPT